MGKLYDVVVTWLHEGDWEFVENQRDNGDHWTRSRYKADNATFDLVLETSEAQEEFFVYVYWPTRVPPDRCGAVAELMARINYGMRLGNFELDMRDGEIRYKVSVDVEGAQLVPQMIENMVRAALSTADRYAPAIMSCSYGDKNALDALRVVREEATDEVVASDTVEAGQSNILQ